MKNKKELIKKLAPLIIFLLIMVLLTALLWPQIKALATDEGRARFKAYVDGIGILGWFVTLGIQILQVFIAFIPGEPIELMLGFVWGPWLGMLTCLVGIFLGTLIIFLLVKRFGRPFVRKFVGDKDMSTYKFLSNPRKIDLTLFILFFVPGTPKDALTYIAPLAPIKPMKYLLITTIARIPSVITSTLLGDSIAEGEYLLAIIVFAITAVVSVLGIVIGNQFVNKKNSERGKKKAAKSQKEAEENEA
jgi:uncharacterized membrane protein YdjX (TVP38/TMEM64 family)